MIIFNLKDFDLMINTLNTTVWTATFRSQGSNATKQYQGLGDEVIDFSIDFIRLSCVYCIVVYHVQNDLNDSRHKTLIF
jgi:hypothetical protein